MRIIRRIWKPKLLRRRGGCSRKRAWSADKEDDDDGEEEEEEETQGDEWEAGFYRINKVVDHRVSKDGKKEYEVEWRGRDKYGNPWPKWWLPEKDITGDMIEAYKLKRRFGVERLEVTVDVSIAYTMMRRSVAHALMFAAYYKENM